MSRLASLSLSMALLLAAFPLISIGTTQGPPILWWLGLLAIAVGGAIPPVRRFIVRSREPRRPTRIGMPEDERVS